MKKTKFMPVHRCWAISMAIFLSVPSLTKRLQTLFIFDKTVPGSWYFLDYSPAHLPFFRKNNTLPTAILDKL